MRTYLYYGMIVVRLSILLLSTLCWLGYLQKKMRVEFALGVLLTGIGSLMFAAGIFHIMREAAWLVFFSGLWLLIREICSAPDRKNKISSFLSGFCTSGIGTFALLAVFFLVLLFRSEFTHYDNFSHWATSAKLLIQKDRFPNFSDINIYFQSYPLGSASFIYYITKISDIRSEWMIMLAQAILMSGCLTGMFAFAKRIESVVALIVLSGILLATNGGLTSIIVDTLLPVIAIGAMSLCLYYRDELEEKIKYLIPYTMFLMMVKNSGIFFVIILSVYTLVYIEKNRKMLGRWFLSVSCPAMTLFLWQKHVAQVYVDGLRAKHSMSLENFIGTFITKKP